MQILMDPFAGSSKDENGSIIYNVSDKELELNRVFDEEHLAQEYDKVKNLGEQWEVDEEDPDAFRLALMTELQTKTSGFDIEDFHKVLSKELGVFEQGEKYDYVKDMKHAYQNSLRTSTEAKIFATIPEHYFWDIKTP